MVTKKSTGRITPSKRDVLGAPAAVSEWKQKSGAEGILVRVPSGLTAKIRTPGIEAFLTQGIIPNGLMPIIADAMKRGDAPTDDQLTEMLGDEKRIQQIVDLANAIAVYCFVEPKVHSVPESEEERDPDLLYVDELDFNDKMFVFSAAVGGTSDVEKFRQQQESVVGALQQR